jgi:hypothetical protein
MKLRIRTALATLILSLSLVVPVSAQDTENRSWTVTWLDAQATDETTSTAMPTNSAIDLGVYIEWSSGVSGGVVTIEEAWDQGYTGVWSVIANITTSAASSTDVYHQTGSFRALRVRISTVVAGGTVTVRGIARPAAQ